MLHPHVLMEDIDVDHWRNLQELLIDSAKERSRIVVIHEDGAVLKCTHSDRKPINGAVERVEDPQQTAKALFEENRDTTDLVVVFERDGFDQYFAQVQGEWSPEEDLDEYVRRAYRTMEQFPDAIVTYPGPANAQLGLQWKVGASYEDVSAAVAQFVPEESSAVFGVFDGDELWATLVLGFDSVKKIDVLTTVDPSMLTPFRSKEETASEISEWVSTTYRPCKMSVFTDVQGARDFLEATDKAEALAALASSGRLTIDRLPPTLQSVV